MISLTEHLRCGLLEPLRDDHILSCASAIRSWAQTDTAHGVTQNAICITSIETNRSDGRFFPRAIIITASQKKKEVTFIDIDILKKKNQREKRIVNTDMACHSLKLEILDRLKSSFLLGRVPREKKTA